MINLCKTLPLSGPGGDQLLTPSLQLFLLLQQYIYTLFNPLCVEYVCIVLYNNMWPFMRCEKEKEKYLFNVHRRAGWTPCPPPSLLRWRSCGGGGRLASHVLPGDFEGGRGYLWQVNSAGYSRGRIWQIFMARHFGGFIWRVILAHSFGGFP